MKETGIFQGIVCYIGIGSNLAQPKKNCLKAVEILSSEKQIRVARISSWYKTEPVVTDDDASRTSQQLRRLKDQPWFINGVAEIVTTLPARDLLQRLLQIEGEMGRSRGEKGGPRIIDLDLLFYGQDVIEEPDLLVPHPRAHQRRFILEAMNEIASYFIHPAFGVSIRGLKSRLKDASRVFKDSSLNDEAL